MLGQTSAATWALSASSSIVLVQKGPRHAASRHPTCSHPPPLVLPLSPPLIRLQSTAENQEQREGVWERFTSSCVLWPVMSSGEHWVPSESLRWSCFFVFSSIRSNWAWEQTLIYTHTYAHTCKLYMQTHLDRFTLSSQISCWNLHSGPAKSPAKFN